MLENADIILKNGETCYSKFDAVLIGKTVEQEDDGGVVYITNKRLLFKGKKMLACSMARVLTYDTTPSKLSLHMENGNLIVFDTIHTFAPSITTHISSIVNGAGFEDIVPLKTIGEQNAEQEQECASKIANPEYPATVRRAKSAKKRRKSRKKKIAEDLFVTLMILLVIGILYFFF